MRSNFEVSDSWNMYEAYYRWVVEILKAMDEATFNNDAISKLKFMNAIVNHVHARLDGKFPKKMDTLDKQLSEVEGLLQKDGMALTSKAALINKETIHRIALTKLNTMDRELKIMMTQCGILPQNSEPFRPGEIVRDMF